MTMQSFRPYKVGAAYRTQSALEAQWTTCGEWRVVESFGDPVREAAQVRAAVGLQDASAIGKLDLQGTRVEEVLSDARQVEGTIAVLRVKPGRALVLTETTAEGRVRDALAGVVATSPRCAHLTTVTSGLAAFWLVGPRARDVLGGLTALDVRPERLPRFACAPCELARVHATIYRADWGDLPAYLIVVGRDLGEYIWTTVRTAGSSSGLTPFGLGAERLLRPVESIVHSTVSIVS